MEKIQSAIAKARADRNDKVSPSQSAQFRHRPYSEVGVSDNGVWDALEMIEPSMRRLRAQRIVTLDRGKEASDFDKLRTRMLQQMQVNGWRRVAITSPGPASGKSTIALNLAFSVSRQARSRMILAEMDMRKPTFAKMMRLKTDHDFAEVINGNAPFEDHAVRLRPNLALGFLKNPMRNPAELLQDPGLAKTLDEIEELYDPTIMMFDMPPCQVSDDMLAFADKVDCVMIVAAAERTKISELDACEREMANVTNVLGVVLNKCRFETSDNVYEYYG